MKTIQDFYKETGLRNEKVGLINLGCARNLVDSQVMLGEGQKNGAVISEVADSDVVIINTCSFIEEAKQESIDTILDVLELKKQGKIKKVVIAGCLAQRYTKELEKEFKEADAIIGTQNLQQEHVPAQVSLTPKHFAYIKICESCYNQCSFCIIPKIKGKFISRTMESIITEVKKMDENGVKELNIIGQDITAYGMDIYREKSLARLLKDIVKETNKIEWIRILYAFPAHVTDELIEVIGNESKICKYIDIPLQHVTDHLLKSMNRNITKVETIALIEKFRKKIPSAALRTTFVVGLPGETDKDFEELMCFVKDMAFEKVGVFKYSHEEGTVAYDMPNQVSQKVKNGRFNRLMAVQQEVSKNIVRRFVGQTLKVLIEEKENEEEFVYSGRSEYDAPEVDGIVYVHAGKKLMAGQFIDVKISDAYEYDLIGDLV
ncbi:Ribosomal protein S12p Asp88 (E. coli) methylthiotransferase [hydrothermal vent metagenome]|uniref:Ribosomal protein S12p Asp88 (E. coli) methylthiotransferase n=1 Tax=hydrothermal vent metagenome TaxID=652676 RepID=A0A3B1E2W8_9ZZZZ